MKAITPKRKRVQFKSTKPSLTKQAFGKEANINTIMAKFEKSGLLTHVNEHQGNYGDFSQIQPYQDSLNQIMLAQNMFESLPATIRNTFANDPAEFLQFANNPDNLPEMEEMGLIPPQTPSEAPEATYDHHPTADTPEPLSSSDD